MYKADLLPLAESDIREAAVWYEKKQKGLGRRFTSHVRKKVHVICEKPAAFAIRHDQIRTAILDTFPFMIHYAVEENTKTVIIVAVLHTSRDPGIWENR